LCARFVKLGIRKKNFDLSCFFGEPSYSRNLAHPIAVLFPTLYVSLPLPGVVRFLHHHSRMKSFLRKVLDAQDDPKDGSWAADHTALEQKPWRKKKELLTALRE